MRDVCFIDTGAKTFVDLPVEIKDQREFMHDKLDCDTLETVMIAPDLVLWIDEEGTFKENNHVSLIAYAEDNQIKYYNEISGNILITSFTPSGETTPLDKSQRQRVEEGFRVISTEMNS